MSEQTTEQPQDTPREPQDTQGGAEGAQEPQEGTENPQETLGDTDGPRSNREAAKYRTRLRAAEAELSATRAQVSALQAAAVARELGALEVPAEVLALAHPDPAEFLDAVGTVARDALVEAAGVVRERYNLRAPEIAPYAPALAPGGPRPAATSSWAAKLQN